MKIAVVGAGYWGRNLVRIFADLGALAAVCDADQALLAEHATRHPHIQTYPSFADLLSRSQDITAVAISTPAVTHHDLVKQALLAGKDVFVEKPLSLTLAEAQELDDIALTRGRILMVDHILRFHPAVIKLKELIDAGALGKLRYIYSNRLNIGRLRKEENILWSFAPHDISVILFLTGEEPVSVHAMGEAYLQEHIYDVTLTQLSFSDRLQAHIFVSWLHPFKEQKFVVVGDRNMAVFDDTRPKDKLVLYPHRVEWVNRIPVAEKAEGQPVDLEEREPLKLACSHFLDCIRERKPPLTDGAEGIRVLRVLDCAQRSLDQRASGGV
jgi:UDP-2-acetamido-3-amino-2,3-dideoxy-glucuronate N-acetyltransferase